MTQNKSTVGFSHSLKATGKFAIVDGLIYDTLSEVQAYINDYTSNAIPGQIVSVVSDGINNGAYMITTVALTEGDSGLVKPLVNESGSTEPAESSIVIINKSILNSTNSTSSSDLISILGKTVSEIAEVIINGGSLQIVSKTISESKSEIDVVIPGNVSATKSDIDSFKFYVDGYTYELKSSEGNTTLNKELIQTSAVLYAELPIETGEYTISDISSSIPDGKQFYDDVLAYKNIKLILDDQIMFAHKIEFNDTYTAFHFIHSTFIMTYVLKRSDYSLMVTKSNYSFDLTYVVISDKNIPSLNPDTFYSCSSIFEDSDEITLSLVSSDNPLAMYQLKFKTGSTVPTINKQLPFETSVNFDLKANSTYEINIVDESVVIYSV